MSDVFLFGFDAVVLVLLLLAYLRVRQVLRAVAATTSPLELPDASDGDGTDGAEEQSGAQALRVNGVLRRGRLLALFVVVQVDRDWLALRSRPKFLGLHLIVPRVDVARAELVQASKGAPPQLALEPVEGRAVGLQLLRLQLKGDVGSTRQDLAERGWVDRRPDDRRGGRARRANRGGGGRVTASKPRGPR